MLLLPITSQNVRKLPDSSGILTEINNSLPSPISARSVTCLNLSKFRFAPELTAIIFLFFTLLLAINFFIPAIDRAPAGSDITLVSSYMSLIAAHVSSIETSITSSTYFFEILKVSSPILLTAQPSTNRPT